ncbi:receptor-type tyrosine-protein phosphatase kappa [Plakobranchus ocellatus]|uniref:protein-tyrosine-phosphatase n=1 Tax=Plakobranchus ocellatus TaxID=259542 RepID=A0AAV4BEI0_9GAST|nr:receptor-type tyrosine-protein phosphatase kappa [Plakobranchus ocellatus]
MDSFGLPRYLCHPRWAPYGKLSNFTECPNTTFGQNCGERCNTTCLNRECNHVTGTCDSGCVDGYISDFCEQACDQGTYGEDCNKNCSDTCAGETNSCNHVNGTCDQGCEKGYLMPLCTEKCPNTTFGQNCAESCNTRCLNRECHHVNGTCASGCVDGYIGVFCEHVLRQNAGGENSGAGGGDSGSGVLVPAIVGAVVAVAAITALIVGILCWKRRNGPYHESGDGSMIEPSVETGNAYCNPALDTGKPERPSRQSKPRSVIFVKTHEVNDTEESEEDERSETSENPYTNILSDDTSVPVEELKAYLHQHSTDSHFKDEFMAIPMDLGHNQNHGVAAQNSKKNRYKNIIPYDANRVLLEADEMRDLADYINASYVKGYNNCETFIASQGPNDVILNDFVRMLWEQNIDRVVMLTHLIELGKKKCTMYWPEDGEKTFGEIKMQLLTTRVFAEYTIRHLRLCKGGQSPRDVTQFHFTAWPDKSVPENPWGLVDFQQRVMAEPGPGRLLVHCSAGVGRTGTFIALCNLLKEAEATGKMDFRSTLHKLRQDRMHMIQTIAQYTFLHKAALVGHMTSGTITKVKDIAARFQSLEGGARGDISARTYEQEFDNLAAACDEDTIMSNKQSDVAESVYGNEKVMANKGKDRLNNILPNEMYRPVLVAQGKDEDNYINAVLVPNLKKNSHDILTQLPLPTTVTDFWRLVTQFDVGLVVAIDVDSRITDESIGDFLPGNDSKPLKSGRFEISSTTVSENSAFKEMSLTVQKKSTKGSSTSAILLDRLEVDQRLTVPLVVGAIKAIRPQVIPTVDQYKCLYRVLKLSYDTTNVYGNV